MNVWRNRLDRWLSPAARHSPLSPNAISLLALLLNVTAAVCLFERLFLVAIAFVAAGGLLDAFDGIVARAHGTTSRFGDFLDHCLDRVSDTLVAAGWLLGNAVSPALTVGAVILIMMNGYMGTQIEATFHERNYDSMGRGEFVLAFVIYPIVSSILFRNGWATRTFAALTVAEWLTLLLIAVGIAGIVQRFALARRLDRS